MLAENANHTGKVSEKKQVKAPINTEILADLRLHVDQCQDTQSCFRSSKRPN